MKDTERHIKNRETLLMGELIRPKKHCESPRWRCPWLRSNQASVKSEAAADAHVGPERGGTTRYRSSLRDSTGTSLTVPAH
ncbi:hypothetical protein E2C01_052140 [Portunus trituberculatus]|uniref:Uncharacterized protein n=1 Tax=Portunus trituberculatus TaxID=210409 RepID=A0A5B7GL42_PORTR|nr:hypothetical protein [Portunus trituberculatus]